VRRKTKTKTKKPKASLSERKCENGERVKQKICGRRGRERSKTRMIREFINYREREKKKERALIFIFLNN
jgi:hypothetical protein